MFSLSFINSSARCFSFCVCFRFCVCQWLVFIVCNMCAQR